VEAGLLLEAEVRYLVNGENTMVSSIDSTNVLTGANFGLLNDVRAIDGGSVNLKSEFRVLIAQVPEPATLVMVVFGWGMMVVSRRDRKD
jgi:hypothetical protein